MMGKSLTDKLNELPGARRDRLHAEYLTRQQLRKAKKLTQTQLAETLNIPFVKRPSPRCAGITRMTTPCWGN